MKSAARIVLAPGYSPKDVEDELLADIHTKLYSNEFKVTVEFVGELPRGGRGKLGLLDQRLPIKLEYIQNFGDDLDDRLNRPNSIRADFH